MKIAMLTSDYLPNIGGIASHIYELSKALIAHGHEVEVWVWDRKEADPAPTGRGEIPVRMLPAAADQRSTWSKARTLAGAMNQAIGEFNPDILHLHTLDPLLLALRHISRDFTGTKVWTNHSSRFLRKADSFFWRQKMRFYGRALDGLLAPSQELLEKSACLGVAQGRYLANGVDLAKFVSLDQAEARQRLGLPLDKFILLSTRRFSPKNGIRFLALALPEVARQIPGALCVFCGNLPDAKDWPVVEKIVQENRLETFTRFEGAVPNAEINTYLNAADLVVLPSLMEATSISGLEAMSASRPLVGTRVGGIPELIEEGVNGLLVAPGRPDALAEGIIRAYRELDLAEAGRRAREKVEAEFTWPRLAQKTVEFYQSLGREGQ
ncbi:MAG: glycosyltransferase family 4 protein [Desulfuromonadales bacterium]|nr:glycosyltransferase family 4 protein [Desulfuromonadales bacterium]